MKYTFPTDYADRTCYLVAINASLIPLVAGALKQFEQKRAWHDDPEFEQSYNAFAALQACMMKCCIDDLIESNDRIYRMLDTALFGTGYSVSSVDPLVVVPPIAPTHSLIVQDDMSLLGRAETMRQLLDNALNGAITAQYSRADGIRDLLELIRDTLIESGNLDPEILAKLAEIEESLT